jgi:DnaJ-class molecular chaperone
MTTTRTCPRCHGSGLTTHAVEFHNKIGGCFCCGGLGRIAVKVPTRRTKMTPEEMTCAAIEAGRARYKAEGKL